MPISPPSKPSSISPVAATTTGQNPTLASQYNQNTCITASMTCYFWYHRGGNCTNQRCKYAHTWVPGMRIADRPQRVPGLNRAVAGRNLAMAARTEVEQHARIEAERRRASAEMDAARTRRKQAEAEAAESLEAAKRELEQSCEDDAFAALALGREWQVQELEAERSWLEISGDCFLDLHPVNPWRCVVGWD